MIIKSTGIVFVIFCSLLACNYKKGNKEATKQPLVITHASIKENPYKDLHFDSKYDLSCGMPVSAGLTDTASYQKKLYGFCCKECKEAFVMNPSAYIISEKKVHEKH